MHPTTTARVKLDYGALARLQQAVTDTATKFSLLEEQHTTLKAELAAADAERVALARAFEQRSAALGDVEARCADAYAKARDLQGRLDEAARQHAAMSQDLTAKHAVLGEKVGAGLGQLGQLGAGCPLALKGVCLRGCWVLAWVGSSRLLGLAGGWQESKRA